MFKQSLLQHEPILAQGGPDSVFDVDITATQYAPHYWVAVTSNYDGAPDASGIDTLIGHGKTEEEAIADLKFQREEYVMPSGPPCECGFEEGRSEADRRYHEENCRREA